MLSNKRRIRLNIFTALLCIGLLVINWDVVTETLFVPIEYSPIHKDGSVVLFSTQWCGYCQKLRSFFEEYDISYTELDIEKSTDAHNQYRQLNGRGVPLVVANRVVIRGYDPSKILSVLKPEG